MQWVVTYSYCGAINFSRAGMRRIRTLRMTLKFLDTFSFRLFRQHCKLSRLRVFADPSVQCCADDALICKWNTVLSRKRFSTASVRGCYVAQIVL